MRSDVDESFHSIFCRATKLAEAMAVTVDRPRIVKRSVYRANSGFSSDINDNEQSNESIEEYYKVNLYVPLLDGLLLHLKDRFGPTQQKSLALGHLVPAFLCENFSDIQPAIEMYSSFITSVEELRAEFSIWKHWSINSGIAKEINTAAAALENCPQLTMPNLHALLYILTTLPVTTAEPERVFSKVEKTATSVRSMSEDRLEALIMLQAHLDKTPSSKDVIDHFSTSSAHRVNFIL